jgi:hypothetical protein
VFTRVIDETYIVYRLPCTEQDIIAFVSRSPLRLILYITREWYARFPAHPNHSDHHTVTVRSIYYRFVYEPTDRWTFTTLLFYRLRDNVYVCFAIVTPTLGQHWQQLTVITHNDGGNRNHSSRARILNYYRCSLLSNVRVRRFVRRRFKGMYVGRRHPNGLKSLWEENR